MGEVSRYPHGTMCWMDLETPDVDAAVTFYRVLLGWEVDQGSSLPGRYVVGRLGGHDVAAIGSPRGQGDGPRWNCYVSVDELEPAVARADQLGAEVVVEPFAVGEGGREATIRDPSGVQTRLWEAGTDIGARLVNVPGAWTWSDLSTRDPDAAARFYTDLFGWRVQDVGSGYRTVGMGHLAVGGIRDVTDQPAGVVAHWLPYFVVDDIEAATSSVGDLGGRVLVPASDVPAGRFALHTDPTGAAAGLVEMGPTGPRGGVDGS